jgi:hypothetical protein
LKLKISQYGIKNFVVCVPVTAPAPEILVNPGRRRKNAKIIIEINKI